MGALGFIKGIFGGNPPRSSNSVQGGTEAVKPPTFSDKDLPKNILVPKYCKKSFLLISRKKGATVAEIMEKTGKTRGTIYQEIQTIKNCGCKIVKSYEKPVYRYRLG